MGRRSEPRIAVRVPILVQGTDRRGTAFQLPAETHDISGSGACVTGLNGICSLGSKVEIEFRGRKAIYRVQWLGEIGTPRAGFTGLRCLEPGKFIWDAPLPEWTPDTYDPNHAQPANAQQPRSFQSSDNRADSGWPAKERRKNPRQPCRIEALVSTEDSSIRLPGRVTDISLGGCYVEMLSPLPKGSPIEIAMNPGETVIHALGQVVTSQMGLGMGVVFTAVSPEDYEKLRKLAPPAEEERRHVVVPLRAPSRGVADAKRFALPAIASSPIPVAIPPPLPAESHPDSPTALAQALDAVVRVLVRKGILTFEELSREFENIKASKR
jgi:PilZ domain-containing protein